MNKKHQYRYHKSTRNMHVFENPQLGSYYLPKTLFDGPPPQIIYVCVTLS